MSSYTQPQWIHIAGNPPNVMRQTPPYWRYRLGHHGAEHTFDKIIVTGLADTGNNTQGSEVGASFLLWQALYGAVSVAKTQGKVTVHVALHPGPGHQPPVAAMQTLEGSQVRVWGAPDRVKESSPLWWRAQVNEQLVDLSQFVLEGHASPANFRFGEHVSNENPLRRLWLEFTGSLRFDSASQRATIKLI